jgi:hypothetical protein
MTKRSWRSASIACIAIWAAIWLFFLLVRSSTFDIRVVPGIGPVMLLMLVATVIAPLAATVLAVIAVAQRPAVWLNWITLGVAIAVLSGQAILFTVSRWM